MSISADQALGELKTRAIPGKAKKLSAYHKIAREYLGVPVPDIDEYSKVWLAQLTLDQRLTLASGLWKTDIHEARIGAAKLLTQARIRPDDSGAWELIKSRVPDFDAWAIADHVSIAGQKRLVMDIKRIDDLEAWTTSEHMWTRRAALVMAFPWARHRYPKPPDAAIQKLVLGWSAGYVSDRDWFMQKVVAWWLRDPSKKDPDRVTQFLEKHGDQMKPFARREAGRLLAKTL